MVTVRKDARKIKSGFLISLAQQHVQGMGRGTGGVRSDTHTPYVSPALVEGEPEHRHHRHTDPEYLDKYPLSTHAHGRRCVLAAECADEVCIRTCGGSKARV